MSALRIEIVRPYGPMPDDGCARVLVNRLWPRGVSKGTLEPFEWMKDVAPSTDLRRWYGHDPKRADEFRSRYRKELELPVARDCLVRLRVLADQPGLLLITATRDIQLSEAWVLRDTLLEGARDQPL